MTPEQLRTWKRRSRLWEVRAQELADERYPLLSASFAGTMTPKQRRLLQHIERQLDWYELRLEAPSHAQQRKQLAALRHAVRACHRFLTRINAPSSNRA